MKHTLKYITLSLLVFAITIYGCKSKDLTQEIKVVQYEQLNQVFTQSDDILYVVNFWATWCAPCVGELPDFMEVNSKMKDNAKYKMVLVSLDDVEKLDDSVKKMAKDMNLNVEQYLLDDVKRMNEWIPAIYSEWSGTIPATLFIKNGKTLKFVSEPISKEELENAISQYL